MLLTMVVRTNLLLTRLLLLLLGLLLEMVLRLSLLLLLGHESWMAARLARGLNVRMIRMVRHLVLLRVVLTRRAVGRVA